MGLMCICSIKSPLNENFTAATQNSTFQMLFQKNTDDDYIPYSEQQIQLRIQQKEDVSEVEGVQNN